MSADAFNDLCYFLSENNATRFRQRLIEMSRQERQAVLQQIKWHRVFMQFYLKCKPHIADLPKGFTTALEKQNQFLLRRGLIAIEHLHQLNKAFHDNNIDFFLFKGLAISTIIHDSPIMRNPKDMDILVREQDVQKTHDTLLAIGYRQHSPDISPHDAEFKKYMQRQKDAVYISKSGEIEVEVHWRLDINNLTLPIDFEDWWQRRRKIHIGGMPIMTFGLYDTLCHLAAHGCISMWGRLCWLLDWHQIRASLSEDERDNFEKIAQQRGLDKMVNIADTLCTQLFLNNMDNDNQRLIINGEKTTNSPPYIVNLVLSNLQKKQYPLGYKRYFARMTLKSGLKYKLHYIYNAFRMLIAGERNINDD